MIFLTVGTQLPFDRLARAMDAWCGGPGSGRDCFAQVGRLGASSYRPQHMAWAETVTPTEFVDRVKVAQLIVSHAGMGSIITAMQFGKPIVIMPRRAGLGEQRNDHQLATVQRLGDRPGIYPVLEETELGGRLDEILGGTATGGSIQPFAEESLIAAVRGFIKGA